MKILLILLIAIVLGILLYAVFRNRFTKRNKIILSVLFVVIVILLGVYTIRQDDRSQKTADLIAQFNRGETLQCGEFEINSKDFNLISGTLSFVGKQNTQMQGQTIPMSKCY